MRLTAGEWQVAQTTCTAKQLEALELYRRGAGRRRISVALGISETAVRDRLSAAALRIEKAMLTPS